MINFTGHNCINFTGIKVPKFNPSLLMPKITDKLPKDVFCKNQSIPQSLIEDGISEKTFNKAKKFVMKSVNGPYPKESLVIINNDKIEDMIVCNAHSGSMSIKALKLVNNQNNNIALIHSHPKTGAYTTCPPSLGDWDTLNKYPGIKSMYVISADGEYALLRKISNKTLSEDETDKVIGKFMLGYIDYLRKMNIPACRECVNLFEYGSDIVSRGANPSNVSKRFGELVEKIDHAGLTVDYVDGFWKKFGDKLNVIYESNLNKLC